MVYLATGNPSSHNNGSSSSIGGGGGGNGTTSASERSSHDDRDLEDSSDGEREGTIRVGKDYQASIPPFIKSSHEVERRTAVRWEQCENELTCPELRQKHVHVVHDLIQDPVPGSSHEVEMRTADDGEEDDDGPEPAGFSQGPLPRCQPEPGAGPGIQKGGHPFPHRPRHLGPGPPQHGGLATRGGGQEI